MPIWAHKASAEALGAAADRVLRQAFPGEDMTAGGRLLAFNIQDDKRYDSNGDLEMTEAAPKRATHQGQKKSKGYKSVTAYPDEVTDHEIFAGDVDRIRYGTLIRLAKSYSVSQIAAHVNAHHPKALTAQTVSDRLQSAYKYICKSSNRTVAEVKAEVEQARRDNGFVANGRRTKGSGVDLSGSE